MSTTPIALARPAASPLARGAGALVLVLLAALAYHRTAATLWTTWMTNDTYSHGPLIPLVSLWLAWRDRDVWRTRPAVPDARGLALVAAACAMQVLGVRADVFAMQGWSLPVLVAGILWTFQGAARLRALWFPVAFLVFMLTFPPFVVLQLSYALKTVAVEISTRVAAALGAEFQQKGMSLFFATGELRVEHPCSGLRSLIALVAMGTLLAWLTPGAWWRRLLLVIASLPVAILANAARLVIVFVAAQHVGVPAAAGRVHDLSGYLVYVIALGALLLLRIPLAAAVRERRP